MLKTLKLLNCIGALCLTGKTTETCLDRVVIEERTKEIAHTGGLNKSVMSAFYIYKTSHPSDPVASSLTLECVSSELSMAWERPLENTLRSAVLVTLVSASERRDPSADTESSQRIPPATPLCSVQQHTRRTITLHQPTCNTVIRRYSRNAQLSVPFVC